MQFGEGPESDFSSHTSPSTSPPSQLKVKKGELGMKLSLCSFALLPALPPLQQATKLEVRGGAEVIKARILESQQLKEKLVLFDLV